MPTASVTASRRSARCILMKSMVRHPSTASHWTLVVGPRARVGGPSFDVAPTTRSDATRRLCGPPRPAAGVDARLTESRGKEDGHSRRVMVAGSLNGANTGVCAWVLIASCVSLLSFLAPSRCPTRGTTTGARRRNDDRGPQEEPLPAHRAGRPGSLAARAARPESGSPCGTQGGFDPPDPEGSRRSTPPPQRCGGCPPSRRSPQAQALGRPVQVVHHPHR
jgi:hypothetical protein